MVLGNDNRDQSSEKQLEAGQALEIDHENELGYNKDPKNSLTLFSNFAIAYSCCSVLSGITPLWGDAMVDGGSLGVIWGWVVVSFFTTLSAMSLAEIASAYPRTGGLYIWVSRLAPPEWVPLACWVTGWFTWIQYIFSVSSVGLGCSQFIAGIIQIWEPEVNTSVYMQYGVFFGICVLYGIINSVTVRFNGIVNEGAFYINLLGLVLIVIVGLAITKPLNTGSFVFTQFYNGSGFSNDGYGFLLALLQSQFTLTSYEGAVQVADETNNPARAAPFGIMTAVLSNAVTGFIFLMALSFMVKDFDAQILSENAIHPQLVQVLLDSVSHAWTLVFVIIIMLTIFFSGNALLLAASRMVYAFSRDGALPRCFCRLNKRTGLPVNSVWLNVAVAVIIGILYMINSTAFEAIVSVSTIGAQSCYLVPIMLRITIARKTFKPGPWRLGKFAYPIGAISCCWLLFGVVLFVLPTQWPVDPDNMNYAVVPYVFIMLASGLWFALFARHWFTGPYRIINGQRVLLYDDEEDESIPSTTPKPESIKIVEEKEEKTEIKT
ncbi:amino acid transporter [Lichtheimia corymbifera JMRC:FSU:9682]|uniref:Amino acid transporter n=1 Tax=Lichtheimia corymbifera JMRC:FSU:9682 TaxID=1263082 RepID=A0A068S4A9_9FUNG|nr:amino acid transporter [Lichtheimia corymbifera JMRC:FSU:9682]